MSRRAHWSSQATRRGMTLIEVAILVALSAVITGIVISGVVAVYRFNRSIDDYSNGQQALNRFSSTLRDDIHRAESCLWTADEQTLVMELADAQRLKYFKHQKRWVRSSRQGEAAASLMAFGLDESFMCESQIDKASRGELIRLTLSNASRGKNSQHSQAKRPLQCEIVAEVGRDYQHLLE